MSRICAKKLVLNSALFFSLVAFCSSSPQVFVDATSFTFANVVPMLTFLIGMTFIRLPELNGNSIILFGGKVCSDLRLEKGLSLAEVVERCNKIRRDGQKAMVVSELSKIERDDGIKLERLELIALALKVKPIDILKKADLLYRESLAKRYGRSAFVQGVLRQFDRE